MTTRCRISPTTRLGKDSFTLFPSSIENFFSCLRYNRSCAFPYWVRLETISDGQPVGEARCIEAQPTWMTDNYEQIKHLTLGELMLVASHDAGSYR